MLTLARRWHARCTRRLVSWGLAFVLRHSGTVSPRGAGDVLLKLASSQELFAYWDALRGARGAPERNDIEPGAIRGVLADTFILHYSRKEAFPFRVVGSRTNALFGRELRGAPFLSLWNSADEDEVARVVEGAADGAQPYLIGARGAPQGLAAIDFEVLVLPLRHHGATHARLLGSCAPSVSAAWLGLLPASTLRIASLRALSSTQTPGFRGRRSALPGFRRRGHLFVYSSGA